MRHTRIVRGRPLVVGLATLAMAGVGLAMPTAAAPAPSDTDVTLTSGKAIQSEWDVTSLAGTDNGLPSGGECPYPYAAGLGVDDATYNVNDASMGDAFDYGLLFFVNHHEVVAPSTWDVQVDPTDNSLNRVLTSGPTSVGGLGATVEYRALPTQQVLRSTVYLTNPSHSTVRVPFTVASNFGSDSSTVVVGSSSGDSTLGATDRWVVTADDAATPSDAVNTTVFAGPGNVAAAPRGTSLTVFDCSDTDGAQATYDVTIPAGGTRALMFFNELSGSNAGAVTAAARFSANPAANNELLTGLSTVQRDSIVNWNLGSTRQPDGKIRELGSKHYKGNNVYNGTGKRQTVKTRLHRGDKQTFKVRLYNDGSTTASFAAHGFTPKGAKVRYIAGGHDVTAQMNSDAGLSFTRAPGKYLQVKVKMKIKKGAAVGSRKVAKVLATNSVNGFDKIDMVRAVVRVR